MSLLQARETPTAPLVATGLLGGYVVARKLGSRPLGGVVLGLAGLAAGRSWLAKSGPGVAGVLGAAYLGGFGASHPLAKKVGAWPAVLAVTAGNVAAAYLVNDRG